MTVFASAAALAGVGYALTRRTKRPAAKAPSVRETRDQIAARVLSNLPGFDGTQPMRRTQPMPTPAAVYTPKMRSDSEVVPSAPDALDIALSLDGVFDGASESGAALTARPNDHVPAARTGDDEDAPSPEDLAQTWLAQATESEHSVGTADTIPDVDQVTRTFDELSNVADEDGDGVDDDETTAEYVRRHQVSRFGATADADPKDG